MEKNNFSINEIRKKVMPLAKRHDVEKVYLFGSYAKGEADAESSLDVYIEKGEIASVFQVAGFINDLQDEFDCLIDFFTGEIKDKRIHQMISCEGVLIYDHSCSMSA